MTILVPTKLSPSNDLILDVIQAADPARARAAEQNLVSPDTTPINSSFKTALSNTVSSHPALEAPLPASLHGQAKESLGTQFEIVFLKTFLEVMLPKHGTGMSKNSSFASEMWRSSLAEQLASSLAQTGVGISQMIERKMEGGDST